MKRARVCVAFGVALLLFSLMAAVVAGCGASEKLYIDDTYGYSFSYPSSWKAQSGTSDVTAGGKVAGNVGVYNPDGTMVGEEYVDLAMVMVYELSFTVTDPWASEVRTELEGVLASLENQTPGVEMEKELSQTTTAGLKGYVITYSFVKDGTPVRSTLYFLFDGDREYELTQQAAVAAWDATKPALDSIVASFKPGKNE